MIDARGLSCPEPVIRLKKAMATKEDHYEMMVDNRTSLENVTRFAEHNGYKVEYTQNGEEYSMRIDKQ